MVDLASSLNRRRFLLGLPALTLLSGSTKASAASVTHEVVHESGLVGAYFEPFLGGHGPAVICLTGAGGGLWEAPARALAEAGFAALAVATHNYPGTPDRLSRIPVEGVARAVEWIRRRARPRKDFVALRGWSRGGELALIAASLIPSVKAVLAYAPRTYVALEHMKQNNFGDPGTPPAWTFGGQPVVDSPLPEAMREDPAHPSLEDLHGVAVERIAGPILFVTGEADEGVAGTTSTASAHAAMRRLDLMGFKFAHQHWRYPDAGHNIAGPPPFNETPLAGGTVAGDAAAVADSWPRSLQFLKEASQS